MTTLRPAVAISDAAQAQPRPAPFSLSHPLARAMAERELHYGWVVAGATFVVMLATAGAIGAPGVFIGPLQREFGWSAADISGGSASASFTTL